MALSSNIQELFHYFHRQQLRNSCISSYYFFFSFRFHSLRSWGPLTRNPEKCKIFKYLYYCGAYDPIRRTFFMIFVRKSSCKAYTNLSWSKLTFFFSLEWCDLSTVRLLSVFILFYCTRSLNYFFTRNIV